MGYTLRGVVMKQSVRRSILVASFTVTAGACASMELKEPRRNSLEWRESTAQVGYQACNSVSSTCQSVFNGSASAGESIPYGS